MQFDLTIEYSPERMEASRRRMAARAAFTIADRVPVGFCLVPRYFTPLFGIPYRAIFASAREQFHWQLEFLKFRLERIPEDILCHGPAVAVGPYFDNVLDSAAMGAEVAWPENETLHSLPTIHTIAQMERFSVPEPGTGLWGQARDWWLEMRELAADTRLSFSGVEGRVVVPPPGIGGLSPHMIAVDLVGADFYAWQLEAPAQCHAFLDKITTGLIAAQRYFMELDPTPRGGLGLAEDTAAVLSPAQFREFCAPYSRRLYDTFAPNAGEARGLHICGESTHLHQAFLEELHITSLDLFGYMVEPEVAARNLGGRVLLWGNINPMLMLRGTRDQVKQAAREVLEALGPCGGLLLGDGANVCPGTPVENLVAVTEAAEEYGHPPSPA